MIGINKNNVLGSIEHLANSEDVKVIVFKKEQLHLCMTVKDMDCNLTYDIDFSSLSNSLTIKHGKKSINIKLDEYQLNRYMNIVNIFGQKMLKKYQ